MKILIADDDPVSRLRLGATLVAWGYEVQAVHDGLQAWEALIRPDSPRLAILDWIMPRMDGLQVVRRLREDSSSVPVYIILLTSHDSRDATVQGLEAGADDYVIKPFHARELRARIQAGERVLQLQTALSRRVSELENALRARQRAEEALRKSEEQFRDLAENIREVFFVSTPEPVRVTYVSPAYDEIWGTSRRKVYERPETWTDAIHDEDRERALGVFERSRKGESTDTDYRVVRPDGSIRWIRNRTFPVFDAGGNFVRIVGIAEDITERRRAEELLLKSQQRSHLLFTTIPVPIWVYDLDTLQFLEVNDAAVAHYGYSRSEFLDMKVTDIQPRPEIAAPAGDHQAHRNAEPNTGPCQHRLKDGRTIDVNVSSHTIDFAGRKAVLVVAQDVTEQRRLELELRHSQKLEAVGSLAAGIAHEINTPIQFVGDNVRFLEEAFSGLARLIAKYQGAKPGTEDAELWEDLRRMEEAVDLPYLNEEVPKAVRETLDGIERVATIVRALKDFAHPDRSEKVAADLNKALESTLVVARNELKYVAEVETDFAELPLVPCHLGDLNQVFLNLLVNAAQAVEEVVKSTGKKGRIRVATRQDGNDVTVTIGDTGCGIPPEIRAKIFDPFFTTKEVGRGTGQGLAIARSIVVEKHGGTLTFESEVGHGTAFVVRLPLESPSRLEEGAQG